MAYQGYASGDPDKDAFSIRLFAQHEIPLFLAQSFAKNCGMYGERVGALSILCESAKNAKNIQSQLAFIARRLYSNPPLFGQRVVSTILSNPKIYKI